MDSLLDCRSKNAGCEGEVVGELPSLIPEGTYIAEYIGHDTAMFFKAAKVYVHFRILTFGPFFGAKLYRAYTVRELIGKPGRKGRFKVGTRSELTYLMASLAGGKVRPDRISFAILRNKRIRVRVRTVSQNFRQRTIPESLRYSVIDEIIGIESE